MSHALYGDHHSTAITVRDQQKSRANPISVQTSKTYQNHQKRGMAKDLGSIASSSGTKSKNKPNKKRRDALKKKLAEPQVVDNAPLTVDVNT